MQTIFIHTAIKECETKATEECKDTAKQAFHVCQFIRDDLAPLQLGCGTPLGCEAAIMQLIHMYVPH